MTGERQGDVERIASAGLPEPVLTASLVHPREVFRAAVMAGAHSIVAVHNHPSGDPCPSNAVSENEQAIERSPDKGADRSQDNDLGR